MARPNSHWRMTARSIIANVIAKHPPPKDDDELQALFRNHVSKAYPWGERAMHPYKMWGMEVKLAKMRLERALLKTGQHPLMVKCATCGAGIGIPCKPIGSIVDDLEVAQDAEMEGRMAEAEIIRARCFHEARLIAVGIVPPNDTLPLFARAT